jgi:acetyl/propionyl-CoA carboxylase alpha subunit
MFRSVLIANRGEIAAGIRPSRTSLREKVARSAAITTSQHATSPTPPP